MRAWLKLDRRGHEGDGVALVVRGGLVDRFSSVDDVEMFDGVSDPACTCRRPTMRARRVCQCAGYRSRFDVRYLASASRAEWPVAQYLGSYVASAAARACAIDVVGSCLVLAHTCSRCTI